MSDTYTEIELPASKSECNRLMVISALAGRPLPVFRGECEDIADIRRCLERAMAEGECCLKESGTALRFLIALFAAMEPYGRTTVIRCGGRLAQRPVNTLLKALVEAGMPEPVVEVDSDGVKSIGIVSSRLKGGSLTLPTSVSTQFASALLLTAPYMEKGLRLTLEGGNATSPYIDMTRMMMLLCGAFVDTAESFSGKEIEVKPSGYSTVMLPESVEADWSAASFFYEYIAINGGKLLLRGLRTKGSLQGDSEAAKIFAMLGVTTTPCSEGVVIERTGVPARKLTMDMSRTPDLVPPVVAACCFTDTPFRLYGLAALRHKESDRLKSVAVAMKEMGFHVEKDDEMLQWDGTHTLAAVSGSRIADYSDHRIAMAVEAAGKGYRAKHPRCVEKSFPMFYEEMKKL